MEIADRLDMDKLVAAHNAVCAERNKEARKNDQLHRILLRHFRMKKLARAYSPDNPDTIAETFEQYQQELDQLDKVGKERKYWGERINPTDFCNVDHCQSEAVPARVQPESDQHPVGARRNERAKCRVYPVFV